MWHLRESGVYARYVLGANFIRDAGAVLSAIGNMVVHSIRAPNIPGFAFSERLSQHKILIVSISLFHWNSLIEVFAGVILDMLDLGGV